VASPGKEDQSMPLNTQPLAENFGASITGVDLSKELDEQLFNEIADLFIKKQVLVFRNQHIEPHHQVAFSGRFGPFEMLFDEDQRVPGFPEVAILSNEKVDGKFIGVVAAGDFWHSDQSTRQEPSLATFLYAHKLPKQGGDTEFADMHGAYENLPDEIKRRIEGRMGIHQHTKVGNPRVEVTREGAEDYYKRSAIPNVLHPLVRVHPVSGRKGLYCSPRFTVGIDGMDDAEAQPLLDTLFAYQIAPGNTYRHKWSLGDFVMWDNRSLNHQACGGYAMDDIRLLHRTSVRGDQPF
jgi:taurine dioxygenase